MFHAENANKVPVTCLCFDLHGSILAVDLHGFVYAFHPRAKRYFNICQVKSGGQCCAVNPVRNNELAIALDNGHIVIVDVEAGAEVTTLQHQHETLVRWLHFSPDNRGLLCSVSQDLVLVWAAHNNPRPVPNYIVRYVLRRKTPQDTVRQMLLTEQYIISGRERALDVYSVADFKRLQRFSLPNAAHNSSRPQGRLQAMAVSVPQDLLVLGLSPDPVAAAPNNGWRPDPHATPPCCLVVLTLPGFHVLKVVNLPCSTLAVQTLHCTMLQNGDPVAVVHTGSGQVLLVDLVHYQVLLSMRPAADIRGMAVCSWDGCHIALACADHSVVLYRLPSTLSGCKPTPVKSASTEATLWYDAVDGLAPVETAPSTASWQKAFRQIQDQTGAAPQELPRGGRVYVSKGPPEVVEEEDALVVTATVLREPAEVDGSAMAPMAVPCVAADDPACAPPAARSPERHCRVSIDDGQGGRMSPGQGPVALAPDRSGTHRDSPGPQAAGPSEGRAPSTSADRQSQVAATDPVVPDRHGVATQVAQHPDEGFDIGSCESGSRRQSQGSRQSASSREHSHGGPGSSRSRTCTPVTVGHWDDHVQSPRLQHSRSPTPSPGWSPVPTSGSSTSPTGPDGAGQRRRASGRRSSWSVASSATVPPSSAVTLSPPVPVADVVEDYGLPRAARCAQGLSCSRSRSRERFGTSHSTISGGSWDGILTRSPSGPGTGSGDGHGVGLGLGDEGTGGTESGADGRDGVGMSWAAAPTDRDFLRRVRAILGNPNSRRKGDELRKLLQGYRQYPKTCRTEVWRALLQLPHNTQAFEALVLKGPHPATAWQLEAYPKLKDRGLMEKVLSALNWHCEGLVAVKELPLLVHATATSLGPEPISAFEAALTFLANWGVEYFRLLPNTGAPVNVWMSAMLAQYDPPLWDHLQHVQCSPRQYIWGLLQATLSRVLSPVEWAWVFDHVFARPPAWYFAFVLAYLKALRGALMQLTTSRDFRRFFSRHNPVIFPQVFRMADDLMASPPRPFPAAHAAFRGIDRDGVYVLLLDFPEAVVEDHLANWQRIRREEQELAEQRQQTLRTHEAIVQQEETEHRHLRETQVTAIFFFGICVHLLPKPAHTGRAGARHRGSHLTSTGGPTTYPSTQVGSTATGLASAWPSAPDPTRGSPAVGTFVGF